MTSAGYYYNQVTVVNPPGQDDIPVAEYSEGLTAAQSGTIILAKAFSSQEILFATSSAVPPPIQVQPAYPASPQSSLQAQYMRYDELANILRSLGDATSVRMRGEEGLAAVKKQYAENNRLLDKNRASQPRAERRLHRNAHPRFLHYFQIHREEKVKRLERELEELRQDEKRREEARRTLSAEIEQREQQVAQLYSTESQMKAAQAERQQIFNTVVNSRPPTAQLSNLRYALQSAENDQRAETALLSQIQDSLRRVEGARQLFQRAIAQLREATSMNMGAGVVNMGQAFNRRNNGFGADDFLERGLQMRRDQLLNQARDTALRAGDQLQAAFDSFPMEARTRYPELTRNICNAPLPNLRGANFFGTLAVGWAFGGVGDMMNDMYAQQKLHRNMTILRECEQIASMQVIAVQSVLSNVTMHLQTVEAECGRLKSAIEAERGAIFERTRQEAFGGFAY